MSLREGVSNFYHDTPDSLDKSRIVVSSGVGAAIVGGGVFLVSRSTGSPDSKRDIQGDPAGNGDQEAPLSFDAGGCGIFKTSAEAIAAYASSTDPEADYQELRTELFTNPANADLATERVIWIGENAPGQLNVLANLDKIGATNAEIMQGWVDIGSVAKTTEIVDPNNWACPRIKKENPGDWVIEDTDANELPLPVGEPVIVLHSDDKEFTVSFDDNGNAVVTYKNGKPNTVIPASEFVTVQVEFADGTTGPAVLMAKWACDNMQTPNRPDQPTETTVPEGTTTIPEESTSTTRTPGTNPPGEITTTVPAPEETTTTRTPGTNPPGEITTTVPAPPATNTPPNPTTSTTEKEANPSTTQTTAQGTSSTSTTAPQTDCTAEYCATAAAAEAPAEQQSFDPIFGIALAGATLLAGARKKYENRIRKNNGKKV